MHNNHIKTCNYNILYTRAKFCCHVDNPETRPEDGPSAKSVEHLTHMAQESEKNIERRLVRELSAIGLKALKYSNPHEAGYPDRIVLLPDGGVAWVELKSTGRKPSKLQKVRMEELARRGHHAVVIDSIEGVLSFVNGLRDSYDL